MAITAFFESKFHSISQIPTQVSEISAKLDLYSNQFENIFSKLESLENRLTESQRQLNTLQKNHSNLEKKFNHLMIRFDEMENYSRRESIVLSGKSLPNEQNGENTTEIAINLIKSKLNITINDSEISISHRLGKFKPNVTNARPIIVKLVRRSTKYMLMDACIKGLSNMNSAEFRINESLSAPRTAMFSDLKQVRWKHRSLFKQLYTRDGVIYVKLSINLNHKYAIKTEEHLTSFLQNYPQLHDTYNEIKAGVGA